MYINSGYHNHSLIDFKDKSRPLIVGSWHLSPILTQSFQLIVPEEDLTFKSSIVTGRAHFHFDNADDDTVVTAGNIVLYRPKEFQKYEYYGIDKQKFTGCIYRK